MLPPQQTVYSLIINIEGYAGQFFILAITTGTWWLRIARPDLKRPFKAWNVAIALRIVMSVAMIVAPFVPPQKTNEGKDGGEGGMWYATYALVSGGV